MRKLLLLIIITTSVISGQDFNTGQIYLRVSNAGSTIFGSPTKQTLQIVRISPLISGAEWEVFDYLNDADRADTTAHTIPAPRFGQFHVVSSFDNSYSFAPPAYKVELNSYGWLGGAYAISHYHVTNIDSVTYNSKFGFEILPFVDNNYGNEKVVYDEEDEYIRIFKDSLSTYVGVKFLSNPLISMNVIDWDTTYGRSDSVFYTNLFFDGIVPEYEASELGSVIFPGSSQQIINPHESYNVYIALAVGINEAQLDSNIVLATEQFNSIITSVDTEKSIPNKIVLHQNYPNPFNPSTIIEFNLPNTQHVELSIFNILGQKVISLLKNTLEPGQHKINFNGSRLSSGVYFYRLVSGDFVQTRKMILIR